MAHMALGLATHAFISSIFRPFHFPLRRLCGGGLIWELRLFMASFLSKQKIIQLMYVIHIFPFADPGRGAEIKDSFHFNTTVELKSDTEQLSGFTEGLLTGHKTEGTRQRSKHSTLVQSGSLKSQSINTDFLKCRGTSPNPTKCLQMTLHFV